MTTSTSVVCTCVVVLYLNKLMAGNPPYDAVCGAAYLPIPFAAFELADAPFV
jgi:hypothetical protein